MQGWRDAGPPHPPGTLLERRPDREAVWTSVIIAAGFVMIPAFEALSRLDLKARKKQAADSMRKNRELARRMNLHQWSWYRQRQPAGIYAWPVPALAADARIELTLDSSVDEALRPGAGLGSPVAIAWLYPT